MLEILISPTIASSMESMPHVGISPLDTVSYLFKLIVTLSIMIGFLYYAAKYILPKIQIPSQGKLIEIKDRIGLEPQVSVYIITVQGKDYLIAVSAKGVTLIDKLESDPGIS
jgi:flagellar biogenesis protein FliO